MSEISKYLAKIGKKGGKANSSESQSAKGKSSWAKLSAAERSAIAKERAKKAWETRRKNAAKKAKGKAS